MIQINNLTKQFDQITALDHFTAEIPEGCIYGLVGSNGAGKSTLLRLLCGVYQPTEGSVEIGGEPVYENLALKGQIAFVSDELYHLPGATLDSSARFFSKVCPGWDPERYAQLISCFPLDPGRKLATCSKGMRRQAALILALSCCPRYLLLDEAFDGLDPIVRVALRKLLADDVAQKGTTVIIASHNLRELEDMCDQVGLMHQGHILFQRDIQDLKLGFCKVQLVARPMPSEEELRQRLQVLSLEVTGSVAEIVARGSVEEVTQALQPLDPLLCEGVPLTLEEVFIYEMEAVGYDYNNILF